MKTWALLAAAGLAALAGQADATIFLGLQNADTNGGAVVNIMSDSGTGLLVYGGSYGSFVNAITVQGYPTMPQPMLQTGAIDSSSALAGTLTIYVTQTDLNPITADLQSSFTSNSFFGAAQSVTLSTFIDPTNGTFSGAQLASATFTDIGAQSFTNAVGALTGPFSETTKYVINFGAGGASVNDTINIAAAAGAVPEPASWAMMIAGFGLVGGAARYRRRKAGAAFA